MCIRDSRNTRVQRIAVDDRLRAPAPSGQAIAVDQHLAGLDPQCLDRARHRKESRLQNVDAVDLGHARFADAPAATRLDFYLQRGTALRAQFLAVVETVDPVVAQDHRCLLYTSRCV